MTRPAKKKFEQQVLDVFLEKMSRQLSPHSIEQRESPDFLMRFTDGHCAGIELVELADNGHAAGAAALRRLCGDVEDELKRRGLRAWVLLQSGDGFLPLLAPHVRANRDAIVELVAEQIAHDGRLRRYRSGELRKRGVQFLTLVGVKAADDLTVGPTTHLMGFGTPDFVQAAIRRKEGKLSEYRQNIGEALDVWLLMYAGTRPASGVWCQNVRGKTFVSAFDRTYYLDAFDDACFQVTTTPT